MIERVPKGVGTVFGDDGQDKTVRFAGQKLLKTLQGAGQAFK